MTREINEMKRYLALKPTPFDRESGEAMYARAMQVLKINVPDASLVLNFGCGQGLPELPARLKHAEQGFKPAFAHVDISRESVDRHENLMAEHASVFPNDVHIATDVERLPVQKLRKAVGGRSAQAGLAISVIECYKPARARKVISRMLQHCDSLVLSICSHPTLRVVFPDNHKLEAHIYRGLDEAKKELSSKDWEIKKVFNLGAFSDLPIDHFKYGFFLFLIKRKKE
ncbi:MAG: hypothetical protein V1834_01555 [Candidatus Micrarchaeota archaeon]